MNLQHIGVHQITLPDQLHRQAIDDEQLVQLAHSIAQVGLINPITVRPLGGYYELVAGHRRYLACLRLGHTTIPAIVRIDTSDNTDTAELVRTIENLHRTDLTPIEEANVIARLHRDQRHTIERIAAALHRSTRWVTERLQLADLVPELSDLVHQRKLGIAAALLLAEVTDSQHRAYLTRYALQDGVSTPILRQWIVEWHLAHAADALAPAPLPQMLAPGEHVVIYIPCGVCGEPTRHTHAHLMRVCDPCYDAATAPRPIIQRDAEPTPQTF